MVKLKRQRLSVSSKKPVPEIEWPKVAQITTVSSTQSMEKLRDMLAFEFALGSSRLYVSRHVAPKLNELDQEQTTPSAMTGHELMVVPI